MIFRHGKPINLWRSLFTLYRGRGHIKICSINMCYAEASFLPSRSLLANTPKRHGCKWACKLSIISAWHGNAVGIFRHRTTDETHVSETSLFFVLFYQFTFSTIRQRTCCRDLVSQLKTRHTAHSPGVNCSTSIIPHSLPLEFSVLSLFPSN